MTGTSDVRRRLLPVLEEARSRGFLGPGPVENHIVHALRVADALAPNGRAVDLGSGGGVPGLVLALVRPGLTWTFVEAQERRARWLEEAVGQLALQGRVTVRAERAELTGRGPLRGEAVVVTARSFGPPAVTVECAAPLLALGGRLWVAEPPRQVPGRWPREELAALGLRAVEVDVQSWVGFVLEAPCPDRYPRRVGIPGKRPLF